MASAAVFYISIIVSALIPRSDTQWTCTYPLSPLLPRADRSMYAAWSSDYKVIHLLGGATNLNAWVEYHVDSDEFVDKGQAVLPFSLGGYGRPLFVQRDNLLFYMHIPGNYVGTLYEIDIDTLGTTYTRVNRGSTDNKAPNACLMSAEDKILLVAGQYAGSITNAVKIYDVATTSWSTSGQTLNHARSNPACGFCPNHREVWAAGGWDGNIRRTEIERNTLDGILGNPPSAWTISSSSLYGSADSAMANYDARTDSIIITGGKESSQSRIQVISCETGQVSSPSITLSTSAWKHTAALSPISSVLYIFGGAGSATDRFMHVDTGGPTPSPSTPAPTTPSPTTASPTTTSPTTPSPTTASPTTAAPTTASPTTAAPT
eukprot:CAMPEP_0202696200 /NCGR_PEP_ID=MMETSP1385-20130828/9512_1 /ASSEMBLY_ACC=CAM_ASM_000861 /TAXON_ID=933848 /ORGANISM="Elphidium margaritaceum" /LENGTH=375 /DNA_ID=CAMNT_0049352317 /DNA_START=52 /DNA_END=1175 /DNA_ORIENTATION=+